MLSIKITPLFLFLLLLFVLLLSILFAKNISYFQEGFISFQANKVPLNYIVIPTYSSKNATLKLYDNLFFDPTNANLIEVDSVTIGNLITGQTDLTGNTIANTTVTLRDTTQPSSIYRTQLTGNVLIPQNTAESGISSVSMSYSSYIYTTQSSNTDKYSAFYMPWDDSTYIHIINNTTTPKLNIGTYLFGPANTQNNLLYTNNTVGITGYNAAADDSENNKIANEPKYGTGKNLFQISKYVKYDISNSNLIIQNGDGASKSITVYDRYKNVVSGDPTKNTSTANVTFQPYTIMDLCGQTMVLYMPIALKTVIAVISYTDSKLTSLTLRNLCRFDGKGLVKFQGGNSKSGGLIVPDLNGPPGMDNAISEYYKWAAYWAASGQPSTMGSSSDYMLKTKIIPPVCPACPACSNSGSCTNCGGKGGSGTLKENGGSVVPNNNTRTNVAGAVSNIGTGVTDTANNVINTTGGLVAGAGLEAGALAVAGASGATNLARDAASGTVGLAKDTVGGAVGLAKDTVGGAVGLAKDAASGTKDLLKSSGSDGNSGNGSVGKGDGSIPMVLGTQNQYSDQYSYYGTLPNKPGSNYIPVTTDFSAFSK
jgi:hypothetical protein